MTPIFNKNISFKAQKYYEKTLLEFFQFLIKLSCMYTDPAGFPIFEAFGSAFFRSAPVKIPPEKYRDIYYAKYYGKGGRGEMTSRGKKLN